MGGSGRWPGTGPRWVTARRWHCTCSTSPRSACTSSVPHCLPLLPGHRRLECDRSRWTEPIVFQRVVALPCCFESSGSAAASDRSATGSHPADGTGPVLAATQHHSAATLARRFADQGDNQRPGRRHLYGALLAALLVALLSDGTCPIPELCTEIGLLPTCAVLGGYCDICSHFRGLRDKVIFLAARRGVTRCSSLPSCWPGPT